MKRTITATLFAVYLLLLVDLTLFQFRQHHPKPNLTPFHSIRRDMRIGSDEFRVNFLGNLIAFLPVGFLPPLIWPGRVSAWRVLLASAALSGTIEVTQYLSGRRVADVDDILLNVASALLGYALYAFLRNRRKGKNPDD